MTNKEETIRKPTDDPEYKQVFEAFTKCQRELKETAARNQEIVEELSRPKEVVSQDAFEQYRLPSGKYEASHRRELEEELKYQQEREMFLNNAVKDGKKRLDNILGRLSLKICEEHRTEYVEIVREIISAVYALEKANAREVEFIAKLQADSVQTGYIRRALLGRLGSLKDENSFVSLYLKETLENYRELQPTLRKSA